MCPEPRFIMRINEGLGDMHCTVIIDIHLPVKDGEVQLLELARVRHAGAIHQVIRNAVFLDEFVGHLFDLGRIGHIRLERAEFLTQV